MLTKMVVVLKNLRFQELLGNGQSRHPEEPECCLNTRLEIIVSERVRIG